MREPLRTTATAAGLIATLTLGVLAQAPQATPPMPPQASPLNLPAERGVQLTFPADGIVSLAARDVTVREIFAEWTRQTGATFTNAERLPAQPITVLYENMTQAAVIDSLLRSAAGYFLVPRGTGPVATSDMATVYIIPTSQPTTTSSYGAPAPTAYAPQVVTQGNPNDEIPPVTPATEEAPPQPEAPRTNQPSYLGTPGGIVPIVPVSSGRGSGAGSGGTTPPPPPPPPTGSGS